ncbi:MAG TPA: hypothetical protein VMF35_18355, partial [Acidimicrobiales bacterium]|nr:hypothetical protein [Acidimicrobiales bacterium]
VAKRDEIDAELDRLAPGRTPDLESARAVLDDFSPFWEKETDPERRRELIGQLVERVWIDDKRVVAIRPTAAFVPFFACEGRSQTEGPRPAAARRRGGSNYGSDGGETRISTPGVPGRRRDSPLSGAVGMTFVLAPHARTLGAISHRMQRLGVVRQPGSTRRPARMDGVVAHGRDAMRGSGLALLGACPRVTDRPRDLLGARLHAVVGALFHHAPALRRTRQCAC